MTRRRLIKTRRRPTMILWREYVGAAALALVIYTDIIWDPPATLVWTGVLALALFLAWRMRTDFVARIKEHHRFRSAIQNRVIARTKRAIAIQRMLTEGQAMSKFLNGWQYAMLGGIIAISHPLLRIAMESIAYRFPTKLGYLANVGVYSLTIVLTLLSYGLGIVAISQVWQAYKIRWSRGT